MTSTATAEDGIFLLGGLPTGEYSVEFSLAGHDDVSIADVTVTAGKTTLGVGVVRASAS
ncbi:MAG: carboxypeptidase regulatory-like domain-containing protein [Phycisphaerales bacterium]|nr:MAG: carboxypeptidase regulatory-like domain-containing protein [Phycisphaerales bacterium]